MRFASEADRAGFLKDYLAAIGPLLSRYGTKAGSPYRVALAVFPDPTVKEDT